MLLSMDHAELDIWMAVILAYTSWNLIGEIVVLLSLGYCHLRRWLILIAKVSIQLFTTQQASKALAYTYILQHLTVQELSPRLWAIPFVS